MIKNSRTTREGRGCTIVPGTHWIKDAKRTYHKIPIIHKSHVTVHCHIYLLVHVSTYLLTHPSVRHRLSDTTLLTVNISHVITNSNPSNNLCLSNVMIRHSLMTHQISFSYWTTLTLRSLLLNSLLLITPNGKLWLTSSLYTFFSLLLENKDNSQIFHYKTIWTFYF